MSYFRFLTVQDIWTAVFDCACINYIYNYRCFMVFINHEVPFN